MSASGSFFCCCFVCFMGFGAFNSLKKMHTAFATHNKTLRNITNTWNLEFFFESMELKKKNDTRDSTRGVAATMQAAGSSSCGNVSSTWPLAKTEMLLQLKSA